MIHRFKPEAGDTPEQARKVYWLVWCAVFFGLAFGGPLGASWLGFATPSWYFMFWPLFSILAVQAADWACRFCGVSQEGRKFEIIERDARAALVPFLGEPPEFEIREFFSRKARVDREGIEARGSDGKWKRVLWRDLESCTFAGTRNTVGDYTDTTFTLQGIRELPLLQFSASWDDAQKLLSAIRFYLRGEDSPPRPAL